jgi:hypothetical protein
MSARATSTIAYTHDLEAGERHKEGNRLGKPFCSRCINAIRICEPAKR